MNCYEHTLIIKGDLSETDIKKLFEKYSSIISQNSGKIFDTRPDPNYPFKFRILEDKIIEGLEIPILKMLS